MGIEDKIKQYQFKSNYQKLALNLLYISNDLEFYFNGVFKQEGITQQQFNIMRILRGSRPNSLSTLEIRERMMFKMSDVSRIVDRLVAKKLVSKRWNTTDNRRVDVKITRKGEELLGRMDNIDKKYAQYFSNISAREAEEISNLLDKIHSK